MHNPCVWKRNTFLQRIFFSLITNQNQEPNIEGVDIHSTWVTQVQCFRCLTKGKSTQSVFNCLHIDIPSFAVLIVVAESAVSEDAQLGVHMGWHGSTVMTICYKSHYFHTENIAMLHLPCLFRISLICYLSHTNSTWDSCLSASVNDTKPVGGTVS